MLPPTAPFPLAACVKRRSLITRRPRARRLRRASFRVPHHCLLVRLRRPAPSSNRCLIISPVTACQTDALPSAIVRCLAEPVPLSLTIAVTRFLHATLRNPAALAHRGRDATISHPLPSGPSCRFGWAASLDADAPCRDDQLVVETWMKSALFLASPMRAHALVDVSPCSTPRASRGAFDLHHRVLSGITITAGKPAAGMCAHPGMVAAESAITP